jgi:CheY-like chemotaxis protein
MKTSERKTFFLIEDDPDDQEIFIMALSAIDKDIDCTIFNDGVEALENFSNLNGQSPDFIFIDVNMPRMNGVECLKEIRKLERFVNTRVIMFSTSSDAKIINTAKELGANGFIVKPPSISSLQQKLQEII